MTMAIFLTARCNEFAYVTSVKCVIAGCHHCLPTDRIAADDQMTSPRSQEQFYTSLLKRRLVMMHKTNENHSITA